MSKNRAPARLSVLLGTVLAIPFVPVGARAADGAALFKSQCSTCHAIGPAVGFKMGPNLKGVVGRKPGSLAGFHYTAGFAKADFVWDPQHLDAWLTDPKKVIPGTIMIYHQPDAATRTAIIDFLKTN